MWQPISIVCLCAPQELKETEELDIQLKVFNENKEEDSIELSHRLDDIRAEMEYPFVFNIQMKRPGDRRMSLSDGFREALHTQDVHISVH